MAEKLKPQAPIIDNKKVDDKEKRPQLVEGITEVIKELKALNAAGKKNVLGDKETGKKAEKAAEKLAKKVFTEIYGLIYYKSRALILVT